MFWVPIAFACLINGECVFVKFDTQATQAQCAKVAREQMAQLEANKAVDMFEITCIQVKPPEMI
jgi:hypothetical protein